MFKQAKCLLDNFRYKNFSLDTKICSHSIFVESTAHMVLFITEAELSQYILKILLHSGIKPQVYDIWIKLEYI